MVNMVRVLDVDLREFSDHMSSMEKRERERY